MTAISSLAATHGQGWRQVGELMLAFALSSTIGLERQFHGKSAGLRTQAIVGTASALFLLVSKYGFGDVFAPGMVALDPSRVAAQIVSGIGFLGAGLIMTRRGAIRGLTTAAAVWETAAIGMAAGSGLPLLALLVTGLHFVIVVAYTPLGRVVSARGHAERTYTVTYIDGRGTLRDLLATCTAHAWTINSLAIAGGQNNSHTAGPVVADRLVSVGLTISGPGTVAAAGTLGDVAGVVRIDNGDDDEEG